MSDEIVDAFPLITWRCSGCLKPIDVLSCDSKVVTCECGVVQRLFSCFISRGYGEVVGRD